MKYFFLFFLTLTIAFTSTGCLANEEVLDYINSSLKYFSKDHPKSLGLNIEIKYPRNWEKEEGNRPNIVQKFSNKFRVCVLEVQKLPVSLSQNKWAEISSDTNLIKESFFEELNANDLKILSTKYSGIPGNLVEYHALQSHAGLTLYMYSLLNNFYYKDKMISLQCGVAYPDKETAKQIYDESYPLFRLMGNDIILHNRYSEEPETNENIVPIGTMFILALICDIIFTWGLGLLVPLIIRFKMKKRLSKGHAILVVGAVWLIQVTLSLMLAPGENSGHMALALVALVGYSLIVKKDEKKNKPDA